MAPLHNPALHGRRKDQGKTNFCFPFALGHVLSVATGREVNPLDIVRKLSEDGSVDWGVGIPYPMVGRGLEIAQRGGVCAGGIGPVSGPLMEAYSEACRRDRTTRSADSGGTRPHGPPGAANPAGDAEGILGQLMAETERDCEGRRRESVFWPVYMGFAPPAEPLNVEFSAAMGRADALLDAGMPLMLAFNARMLGGPSSKNHVVAVIGRRKNPLTGECQYLLLDSNSDSTCGDYIAEGGEGGLRQGARLGSGKADRHSRILPLGLRDAPR